jgi:hypothetical protein
MSGYDILNTSSKLFSVRAGIVVLDPSYRRRAAPSRASFAAELEPCVLCMCSGTDVAECLYVVLVHEGRLTHRT